MNQKVNLLMLTIAGIFQQVMTAELNQHRRLYKDAKWFENPEMPFFAAGIKQLDLIDHFGEAERVYIISVKSREVSHPIDVMDVIVTADLISIRYSGIELPISSREGDLLIPADQFTRLINVAIESNWDLMEAIKSHKGGPSEIKSLGK
jgi:hypothetical protein